MAMKINSAGVSVRAVGRDERDNAFLEMIVLVGGRRTREIIALDDFASSSDRLMANLGAITPDARRQCREAIQYAHRTMEPSFCVATFPGFSGRAFVMPDGSVIGDAADLRVRLPVGRGDIGSDGETTGTLRRWKRLAALAEGNTRLMLAIATAMCGPVLALLKDVEPLMIQLVGPREAGKSTIAGFAASVWGAPTPLTWSGTINSIEEAASTRNATCIVLDELGVFNWNQPKAYETFREAVMRIFEGVEKGRMNQAVARRWRLGLFSTANVLINQIASARGIDLSDERHLALVSRLVDVPLPARAFGAYENLHGSATVAEFAGRVKRGLARHHGHAGRALVDGMLKWREGHADPVKAWLRERRRLYIARAGERISLPAGAESARVSGSFATIYASGRLGIEIGVLPWDVRKFGSAIIACEQAHAALTTLSAGGSLPDTTLRSPMEALRRHVEQHKGELVDLREGLVRDVEHNHRACAGYINQHRDGVLELLLSNKTLHRICCSNARLNLLRNKLRAEDILRPGRRPAVKRPVMKGRDRVHVIAVRADAFGVM